jgi:hypothetical protein
MNDPVLLIFPTIKSISEFISSSAVTGVEVNSAEHSITGYMDEDTIILACTEYKARLKVRISDRLDD